MKFFMSKISSFLFLGLIKYCLAFNVFFANSCNRNLNFPVGKHTGKAIIDNENGGIIHSFALSKRNSNQIYFLNRPQDLITETNDQRNEIENALIQGPVLELCWASDNKNLHLPNRNTKWEMKENNGIKELTWTNQDGVTFCQKISFNKNDRIKIEQTYSYDEKNSNIRVIKEKYKNIKNFAILSIHNREDNKKNTKNNVIYYNNNGTACAIKKKKLWELENRSSNILFSTSKILNGLNISFKSDEKSWMGISDERGFLLLKCQDNCTIREVIDNNIKTVQLICQGNSSKNNSSETQIFQYDLTLNYKDLAIIHNYGSNFKNIRIVSDENTVMFYFLGYIIKFLSLIFNYLNKTLPFFLIFMLMILVMKLGFFLFMRRQNGNMVNYYIQQDPKAKRGKKDYLFLFLSIFFVMLIHWINKKSILFFQEKFLWINDFSGMEQTYIKIFGFNLPIIGIVLSITMFGAQTIREFFDRLEKSSWNMPMTLETRTKIVVSFFMSFLYIFIAKLTPCILNITFLTSQIFDTITLIIAKRNLVLKRNN